MKRIIAGFCALVICLLGGCNEKQSFETSMRSTLNQLPYSFTGEVDNWRAELEVRKINEEDLVPENVNAQYCSNFYLVYQGNNRYIETIDSVEYVLGKGTKWSKTGVISKTDAHSNFTSYLVGDNHVFHIFYSEDDSAGNELPPPDEKFSLSLKIKTNDGQSYSMAMKLTNNKTET